MPKIVTKRTDILRRTEVLKMLSDTEPWLACLIALAWMFGKRINEIVRLKTDAFRTNGRFLYVRFLVSKKKTRKDQPIPRPYLKRINLAHSGVPYVTQYIKDINEGYVFPSLTDNRLKKVKMKMKDGSTKEYTYTIEGGHIHTDTALYYLQKAFPKTWWHLFRESLATEMAEHGATEEQLLHWFDWDRIDTAHTYVKRGTKLTEELSERTW